MGGPGSGHRRRPLKTTVEECLYLDINELVRQGLTSNGEIPVFIKSVSALRKKKVGSIDYRLHGGNGDNLVLVLMYAVDPEGRMEEIEQPVPLQPTFPHFGGKRW